MDGGWMMVYLILQPVWGMRSGFTDVASSDRWLEVDVSGCDGAKSRHLGQWIWYK
jgi:hypothetical protein